MPDREPESDKGASFVSIPVNCQPVRVKVTLSISHDTHSADQVTQFLAIEPTLSYTKGEIIPPSRRPRSENLWSLNSSHLESESNLNTHLVWLFNRLVGKQEALSQLRHQGYNINLSCRFGIAHWNTSCELECETISRLARLHMPMTLDIFDEQFEDE